MTPCRLLPHRADDGPANMATDEALLESVAAGPTRAAFRTYTWSAPTLSLGYFQPIAFAEAEPRWRDAPTVRRATGGGALWHDRELTYAIVLPIAHPLARDGPGLYRAVHRAIAGAIRAAGLDARLRGEVPARTGDVPKPFLCFADRDANDVVSGPAKLVGSAQRRRAGATLQHGSILLERSPKTPELPGLADLADLSPDPSPWAIRLRELIPPALGLEAVADDLSAEEIRMARVVESRTYRSPAWTRKR